MKAVDDNPTFKSHLKMLFVSDPLSVMETVIMDAAAELRCIVIGKPAPAVQWKQNEEMLISSRMEIKLDERETSSGIIVTSTMKIHNVRFSDAGVYSCVASNDAGERSNETRLAHEPEVFSGFECRFDGVFFVGGSRRRTWSGAGNGRGIGHLQLSFSLRQPLQHHVSRTVEFLRVR